METVWFYRDGAQQRQGPVSREQLLAALLAAPDPGRVLVWHSGLADWREAGSVPEISQELPPPLPPSPLPLLPPQFQPVPIEEAEGIARLYRRLVLLVGLQLLLSLAQIPVSLAPAEQKPLFVVGVLVLLLGVLAAVAVTAYQLTLLLDAGSPTLWAIAMFLPCLNILMLLVLSAKAQDWCHRYGIKVGFFGPTQESIEELRRSTPPAAR
jgi:hypothetical protein